MVKRDGPGLDVGANAHLLGGADEHRHRVLQGEALRRKTEIRVQPFRVRDRFAGVQGCLQMLQIQFLPALEDDRTLEFLRQFADVPRPGIRLQPLLARGG